MYYFCYMHGGVWCYRYTDEDGYVKFHIGRKVTSLCLHSSCCKTTFLWGQLWN